MLMMTSGWAVMSSALCSSVHNGLTRVASVWHSPLVLSFLNLRSTMTLGSASARAAMFKLEAASATCMTFKAVHHSH